MHVYGYFTNRNFGNLRSENAQNLLWLSIQIGRTVALAINLKSVTSQYADIWIGLKVLKTSKEIPIVPGGPVRMYKIPINSKEPIFVGYDFEGERKMKKIKLNSTNFYYIPTGIDRADNGSFILNKTDSGDYRLTGVYTYLGKVFKIDELLEIGKDVGVKN